MDAMGSLRLIWIECLFFMFWGFEQNWDFLSNEEEGFMMLRIDLMDIYGSMCRIRLGG